MLEMLIYLGNWPINRGLADKSSKLADKSPKLADISSEMADKSLKLADISSKVPDKSLKLANISEIDRYICKIVRLSLMVTKIIGTYQK